MHLRIHPKNLRKCHLMYLIHCETKWDWCPKFYFQNLIINWQYIFDSYMFYNPRWKVKNVFSFRRSVSECTIFSLFQYLIRKCIFVFVLGFFNRCIFEIIFNFKSKEKFGDVSSKVFNAYITHTRLSSLFSFFIFRNFFFFVTIEAREQHTSNPFLILQG